MLAVKTMNGLWVSPKIAGMESKANIRSVTPMVTKTTSIGVKSFLPSTVVRSLLPSYRSVMGTTVRSLRMRPFSSDSSSPSSLAWWYAVQSRKTPKR